jgi:hypothetical protein
MSLSLPLSLSLSPSFSLHMYIYIYMYIYISCLLLLVLLLVLLFVVVLMKRLTNCGNSFEIKTAELILSAKKKIAHAQERTQVRDCLWYRDLQYHLDLNVRHLKFFEQRDAEFSDFESPVTPVQGGDGSLRYEIHRIWGHQPQGQFPAPEYLVQWKGYDTAQMTWVARKTLLDDVPALLSAYDAAPTTAQARKSAPKRAPKTVMPVDRRRSAPLAAV